MSSRYRLYDHRIKNMIAETGDPNLFPDLAIQAKRPVRLLPSKKIDLLLYGTEAGRPTFE